MENVSSFKYLGSDVAPEGGCRDEINQRIGRASQVFNNLRKHLWSRHEISIGTKIRIYRASVQSVLTYACETWSPKKEDEQRLDVFEHYCLRRILGIRWQERSNAWVRANSGIGQPLSALIRSRRLKYTGHVLRMSPSRLPNITANISPPDHWKRPKGGVIKTWRRLVHQDTKELTDGIRHYRGRKKDWDPGGLEWWKYLGELAANRNQWKQITRELVHGPDDLNGT